MTKVASHPYVRPSSLRTEHYDDIPKIWNHVTLNGFEIEPLTGGLATSSYRPVTLYTILQGGASVTTNLVVTLITRSIDSLGRNKTRCYILLLLTVVAESYSTALSKQAKEIGSTSLFLWSCLVNFFCMVAFNICLAQIEVSIAYAIWSAFGTCLVAVVGIVFFNESCDWMKIVCLGLITAGVVGLNLRDSEQH